MSITGPDSAGRTPLLLLVQSIAANAYAVWEENSEVQQNSQDRANARQRLRRLLADPRCNVNPEPGESMQTPLSKAKDALKEDQEDQGSGENFFNTEIVQIFEHAGATDDPRAVTGAQN